MRATRQQIIDAAATAFAEGGYHGATLAKVGERLGISKSAVLYHFQSKEQLLDEMLEPVVQETEALLATYPAPLTSTAARLELLTRMMQRSIAHPRECLALQVDRNLWSHGTVAGRMLVAYDRVVELLAGPEPTSESTLRAAAAVNLAFRAVTIGLAGKGALTDLGCEDGRAVVAICSDVLAG